MEVDESHLLSAALVASEKSIVMSWAVLRRSVPSDRWTIRGQPHTFYLPGRKSDVQESQWLLKLHTYGLLNNYFQPPSEIRTLRTYWRQRQNTSPGQPPAFIGCRKH